MKHIKLSDYISWDDNDKVVKMLNQHSDIDLTYDDGIFFKLAVKHNNVKIVKELFGYLNRTKLQIKEIDSIDYKLAKSKISQILQDAENSFEVSEEMQQVLAPYVPNNDEESQGSETGDCILQAFGSTGRSSNDSGNLLTSDNLNQLFLEDKLVHTELTGHYQEDVIDQF